MGAGKGIAGVWTAATTWDFQHPRPTQILPPSPILFHSPLFCIHTLLLRCRHCTYLIATQTLSDVLNSCQRAYLSSTTVSSTQDSSAAMYHLPPCRHCPWRTPRPTGVWSNVIEFILELHVIFRVRRMSGYSVKEELCDAWLVVSVYFVGRSRSGSFGNRCIAWVRFMRESALCPMACTSFSKNVVSSP